MTIGVFVTPGDLPAPVKNTLGRRNRCFEYDGMGDNNVRFLIEELLPFVARQFDLKLSTSGNDRCIAGGSSGGHHGFQRGLGTPRRLQPRLCQQRQLRRFSRRPRVPHAGPQVRGQADPRLSSPPARSDMENCAGDWFLLDQEMDKALRFSGYDYSFRIINGGHVRRLLRQFSEAMSFLWKDWPKPVQAGPSAPRVRDILLPGEKWQLVAKGWHDARGPACNAQRRGVLCRCCRTTRSAASTATVKSRRSCPMPVAPTAFPSARRASSTRFRAAPGRSWVMTRRAKAAWSPTAFAADYILATPGGGLYVTGHRRPARRLGQVWFVKDGKKTLVDSGLKVRDRAGLPPRPVAPVRRRRAFEVGVQLSDQRRRHARPTKSGSSGCMFPTGKTTPAPSRSVTPRKARCSSRRAGASRSARTTAPRR